MRVVLVSPFDPSPPLAGEAGRAHVGGVERVLHRMAHEVAARGHEVTLLSSAHRASVGWEDEVRHVRIPRKLTVMRAPLAAFAKHLPREADLVHVPATYPMTTGPVLRAAAKRGIPALLDFHFEPDPGTPVGRAAARVFRLVGPRSYPSARVVAVRSLGYGRSAPSLRIVPEDRWRVVPNGVDAGRFRPMGEGNPEGPILFVGRLVPYKGVEVLLHAAAKLTPRVPLVIAGDGPLRPRLVKQARELGLDAAFLGRVSDEALPGLYRSAGVTVLPSVNRQEAFGICLLESMACGTPVIASDLPGVADVGALGGLIARAGDPQAWALALHRARTTELPRGPALAARTARRFAWPVVADSLVRAYEEALGDRAPQLAHEEQRVDASEVEPLAHLGGHALR